MPSSSSSSSSSSSRGSSTTTSSRSNSFDLDAWQNGPITRFDQTSFAEYWDDLPILIVNSYDDDGNNNNNNNNCDSDNKSTKMMMMKKKNQIVVVDPYNVYHRMAIGKYLIENTCGTGGDLWKTNNIDDKHYKHHWYWTYLVQLDWLWKSGRLLLQQQEARRRTGTRSNNNNASTKRRQRQKQRQNNNNSNQETKQLQPDDDDATTAVATTTSDNNNKSQQRRPTTNIAPDSWWSYINLGFSICVYLGASKAGLVPSIQLKVMKNNKKHNIESDPYLQKIINTWYKFFITEYKPLIQQNKNKKIKIINLNKNPSILYPFYRQLWKYHIETIDLALMGSKPFVKFLPSKQEYQFGLGWCNMSEITSAMGWSHLSLVSIMKYGCGTLPSRVLLPDDEYSSLRLRLRPKEYETCQNMIHLSTKTKLELYDIGKFWLRVSHYKFVQYYLPTILQNLNKGSFITKSTTFLILLCLAAIPTSFVEFAFWGLIVSLIVTIIYYYII